MAGICDVDFNGTPGFSEDMNLAESVEEFEKAATREGWRIVSCELILEGEL